MRAPHGRLRITVRPIGGPLQATVVVVPLSAQPAAVAPRPVASARHRRAQVPRPQAARQPDGQAGTGPDEQLLLTDETGELLETDRANVFAVIDGVLLTPPADGRLLPGTTRAAVLRAAHGQGMRTGQKPLTLGELAEASEVFVTNAVVGVLPVTAIRPRAALARRPGHRRPGAALAARAPDAPAAPAAGAAPRPAQAGAPGPARRAGGRPAAGAPHDNYDSFTWNLAHLLDIAGARVEVVRNDEVTAAGDRGRRRRAWSSPRAPAPRPRRASASPR